MNATYRLLLLIAAGWSVAYCILWLHHFACRKIELVKRFSLFL
jgi:hypothetical protein